MVELLDLGIRISVPFKAVIPLAYRDEEKNVVVTHPEYLGMSFLTKTSLFTRARAHESLAGEAAETVEGWHGMELCTDKKGAAVIRYKKKINLREKPLEAVAFAGMPSSPIEKEASKEKVCIYQLILITRVLHFMYIAGSGFEDWEMSFLQEGHIFHGPQESTYVHLWCTYVLQLPGTCCRFFTLLSTIQGKEEECYMPVELQSSKWYASAQLVSHFTKVHFSPLPHLQLVASPHRQHLMFWHHQLLLSRFLHVAESSAG